MKKISVVTAFSVLGVAIILGCSDGVTIVEVPTATRIPSIRIPPRTPPQIPTETPTPLPTQTPIPVPTRTPTPTPTKIPTATPVSTPTGYHWSKNPRLEMPFPVNDGWEILVNTNPATGHYGCRAMWQRNAEILGQFALGRAIDFLERDMVWEKTSPYNFPFAICEKHFPKQYIGEKYVPPTLEEWQSYGLSMDIFPRPVPTIDWGRGAK